MSREQAAITALRSELLPRTARVPKSIVNQYSAGGAKQVIDASAAVCYAKLGLSGVMTANTLKTLLSITDGAGRLDIAAVSIASGSQAARLKITLDGNVKFDATAASASLQDDGGIVGAGALPNTSTGAAVFENAYFEKSCLVEMATNISATNSLKTYLRYQTL